MCVFVHRRSNKGSLCCMCVRLLYMEKKNKSLHPKINQRGYQLPEGTAVGGARERDSSCYSFAIFIWTLQSSLSHANAAVLAKRSPRSSRVPCSVPRWIKMRFKSPPLRTRTANGDGRTRARPRKEDMWTCHHERSTRRNECQVTLHHSSTPASQSETGLLNHSSGSCELISQT